MKKILFCCLTASFFFTAAMLRADRVGKRPGKEMEARRKELDDKVARGEMTPEQAENISAVLEDGWIKLEEERRQMMERARRIRDGVDAEIEKILTPEQLEKFKAHRREIEKTREKKLKKRRKKMNKHVLEHPHGGMEPIK